MAIKENEEWEEWMEDEPALGGEPLLTHKENAEIERVLASGDPAEIEALHQHYQEKSAQNPPTTPMQRGNYGQQGQ